MVKAKKRRKKTKTAKATGVVPTDMSASKSVEVKRISNGYIVSTWTAKGQKEKFASTKKEAKIIAGQML